MDSIWEIMRAQPVTNRLYEMNKAVEQAAAPENQALRKSGQIPPVPIKELAPPEGPAYSVTLSRDIEEAAAMKNATTQPVVKAEVKTLSNEK